VIKAENDNDDDFDKYKRSFLEDPNYDNENLEIKLNKMNYDTTSPDFEALEEK